MIDIRVPYIRQTFPNFPRRGFCKTSEATSEYNNFAWAAGDDTQIWAPLNLGSFYWPDNVVKGNTLREFTQLYRSIGYRDTRLDDTEYEQNVEKIALYINTQGKVLHVARQLSSEKWTSKILGHEDISHKAYNFLEYDTHSFGRVAKIMRREKLAD
jgi:hypothetical protein